MTFTAPAPIATVTRTSAASRYREEADQLAARIATDRDEIRARSDRYTDEYMSAKWDAMTAGHVTQLHAVAGNAGRAIAAAYDRLVQQRREAVEQAEASWDNNRLATIARSLAAQFAVPAAPFSYTTLAARHMDAARAALAAGDRHTIAELSRYIAVNTDWNDPALPAAELRELLDDMAAAIAPVGVLDLDEQLEALAVDVHAAAGALYGIENDVSEGAYRNGRTRGNGLFVALDPSPVADRLGDVPRVADVAPNAFQALRILLDDVLKVA